MIEITQSSNADIAHAERISIHNYSLGVNFLSVFSEDAFHLQLPLFIYS